MKYHFKGRGKMSRMGWLCGSWFSLPFLVFYSISADKSSKVVLLSYIILNNSVIENGKMPITENGVRIRITEIGKLFSYIILNNSVITEIVVLTPFSKGGVCFMTLMTLSHFLASFVIVVMTAFMTL